jgi:hypothetical protein
MPWASARAHARLEACDDGRFVGCQHSDLYGGELWLTTRRTGRLWLRGEAPVRRSYCQASECDFRFSLRVKQKIDSPIANRYYLANR